MCETISVISSRFWQKFRESNVFTKEITRVNLTKYFFGENIFFVFPHCALVYYVTYSFVKNITFTKFLPKMREREFPLVTSLVKMLI